VSDAVRSAIDAWRRKLLDLTKRNRALNFRPTKVSTITVVDERPAEVFRRLYLDEKPMRFKAAPTPVASKTTPAADAPDAEIEESASAFEFAPYDEASLDERHTDEWLQTASPPEALDKSLLRLDDAARASIEEQGVNTLFLALGMIHYVETGESEEFRAPLLFLPVKLERKSARSGYSLRAGDDDPLVNPALARRLRDEHDVALPELPDAAAMPDDYDVQDLFAKAATAIAGKPKWSLKSSVHLGLFSFQKLVMWKDLETNAAPIAAHRMIRRVVLRRDADGAAAAVGLPEEIRALDLDAAFPPESTHQVVDADASQLRAIATVAKDHDLVVEGPPGTGKSQTITNLVAQALGAGKSVLFVAEKMAALSVVHDRLTRAGLGAFCLELHSTKSNKRAVMKELATSLDASLERVTASTTSTQRLPAVRTDLREYVDAVHEPFGSLGVSPWTGYGELELVRDAPPVAYGGPVDGAAATRDSLEDARRRLRELAATSVAVGDPSRHAWRDSTKTFFSPADLDAVRDEGAALVERLADVERRAADARDRFGLPESKTFADVDAACAVGAVLARSPGAPHDVLASAAWNAPPAEATSLVERGRALDALTRRILERMQPGVFDEDPADDLAFLQRKVEGAFGFLAFLDGRYRAARRRWAAFAKGAPPPVVEQIEWLRGVVRVREERRALDAVSADARRLFGTLWLGWRSDWNALADYVRWVVEFRALCVRHALSERAIATAERRAPDVSSTKELADAASAARQSLARLRAVVGWPAEPLADAPIETIRRRVRTLVDHVDEAPRWASFEAARAAAAKTIAAEATARAMDGSLAFDALETAFLRAFWIAWLTHVVKSRPALERFHAMSHEQRIEEFRDLDKRVLVENRARLVGALRERVQQKLRAPELAEPLAQLRGQMARQRGIAPIRRTMRLAGPAIRAIKPCFLMSPLTVAQFLDGTGEDFDLAIFDEASQLTPEDAVGAIFRAKRLVVVGDPKQLPPTNFFAVTSGAVNAPLDEAGEPLFEDAESILEHCMGAGVAPSRLRWHYRSAHESLITFSNVSFYDGELFTFPSVQRGTDEIGLQFEFVADGVYEGAGRNAAEARRVADAVVQFAKEELARRAAGEAPRSLGVGTFNLRQQTAVQDELERRRRDDASIEPFFDLSLEEPFFVKNLENIQGDERDVIFLSVTYARAADGRLRFNLGPLNGENGWRRLNVLTTRARRRMRVFSSIRADDIAATTTQSRGAALLREFLLFAERGRIDAGKSPPVADAESPFEKELVKELTSRGVRCVQHVGASGCRIDVGVVDDAAPDRFVCGIECDGASYRAGETARDRDRLRNQVLEARGWTIRRAWSTDWFKDRKGQIERLVKLVEEDRRVARERAAKTASVAPPPAVADAKRVSDVVAGDAPYVRPVAAPYAVAPGAASRQGEDILAAPTSRLVSAIVGVVETEGPIHEAELTSRVVGMWMVRASPRVQARIDEALAAAASERRVERRGAFVWNSAGTCAPRSRAATKIPAERIAPEEVRAAVEAVLARGHGFTRPQLVNEVRAVFGYGRTGAALDEAIGGVVERMLAEGRLGEGGAGIRLRR